jgi:hypothetical protein
MRIAACLLGIITHVNILKYPKVFGQYSADSSLFHQTMKEQTAVLEEQVKSHPDVNIYFHPERALLYADTYVENFLVAGDYRIGILLDPCRYNAYNCCMNGIYLHY